MSRVVEAVYEKGVLRPLEDPGLEEGERVRLLLGVTSPGTGVFWAGLATGS